MNVESAVNLYSYSCFFQTGLDYRREWQYSLWVTGETEGIAFQSCVFDIDFNLTTEP